MAEAPEAPEAPEAIVAVSEHSFPETKVIVEYELANPAKAERDRLDGDHSKILGAFGRADGEVQFTGLFKKPAGSITSTFGEWRTFNEGHRSQHLGLETR